MANTYTLIASSTVGAGGAASFDFTSIPSTYTDILVKYSCRLATSTGNGDMLLKFNGNATANMTDKQLQGTGSSATSFSDGTLAAQYIGPATPFSYTANTFSNGEIYVPNYAGAANKSVSGDGVNENNASTAWAFFSAVLWSSTAAINQITIYPATGTLAQYSTAYLYGVKNA